jgi:hypothetical protein
VRGVEFRLYEAQWRLYGGPIPVGGGFVVGCRSRGKRKRLRALARGG